MSVNPANGQVLVTSASIAGSYTVAITVTDNCGAATVATFTVNVVCPPIILVPNTLPGGTVNTPYSQVIAGSLAAPNYDYQVTAGALPTGLTLNASSGHISGTPSAAGTFNFTVTATGFGTCSGSQAYSIVIGKANSVATITSDNPDPSVYGENVTVNFTVTGSPAGPAVPAGSFTVTLDGWTDTCTGTFAAGAGSCVIPLTKVGAGTLILSYAGDMNFNPSTDNEAHLVNKANPNCTITPYNVTYDGLPHTATGQCTGIGGAGDVLAGLDLSGTTHTSCGQLPD